MNKLPIFEMFIVDGDNLELAIVESPAIEENFMCFNASEIKMIFNDDKMIVKGPALIPNLKIYRNDTLGERYVYFSEETVRQFAEILLNKSSNKFNIGHTTEKLEANIIESYFTSEENEFNVPKGSWIVSLKINSDDIWTKIKSREFNGFSVEGIFQNELIELKNNKNEMDEMKNEILNGIKKVLFGEDNNKTKEKFVDTPTEPALPTEPVKPEDDMEVLTEEKVQEMINSAIEQLLLKVDELINGTNSEIQKMNEKIEEFGKQPISKDETKETIDAPVINNSYDYLRGVDLK